MRAALASVLNLVHKRAPSRYDVAFYVPWLGPLLTNTATSPAGGAETQIFLLARALARRGSKVCLVVFDLPGTTIPPLIDEVAVSVRPPYRAHRRLGRLLEALSLRRAVIDAHADVVVTRAAGPDVGLAGLFAKLSRRRFVYSSANLSDFDFARVSTKRLNQLLFRLGIRLADEIVVQTAEQARLCEERFGRSPVLIRSIAEPAGQRDRDPEAFLWIGRLVWYKRPLAFIELAQSLPEAKFWMVGVPDPYSEPGPELLRMVEQRAATVTNLDLIAPQPRQDLLDLVGRAVAVVNTADFEGMPNVFLEGWARGVPALALTHDPDRVIEQHRLGAFAQGSSERLVDLARQLWEDRAGQVDVAARCRAYILEHHSPGVVSAQWQEALGIASRTSTAGAGLIP
jgi:glycosyltransferase involved in cell wall biosynthesis